MKNETILNSSNRIIDVKVSGDSMSPLFFDGDLLQVDQFYYETHRLQIGDIVLAKHPYISDFYLIKKVTKIEGKKVFLEGVNLASSTDSRHFGMVDVSRVVGKVLTNFHV